MTLSVVNSQASFLATAGTSLAAGIPSTTAGNLLICHVVGGVSGTASFTMPAGWIDSGLGVINGGTVGSAQVFYLPNCSAGITSVTITSSRSQTIDAEIFEVHSSVGSAFSVELTASNTGNSTSLSVSGGTSASGALDFVGYASMNSGDSIAADASYTMIGTNSQTTAAAVSSRSGYLIRGSSGTASSSTTSTAIAQWVAHLVTFTEGAGAGPPFPPLPAGQPEYVPAMGLIQR